MKPNFRGSGGALLQRGRIHFRGGRGARGRGPRDRSWVDPRRCTGLSLERVNYDGSRDSQRGFRGDQSENQYHGNFENGRERSASYDDYKSSRDGKTNSRKEYRKNGREPRKHPIGYKVLEGLINIEPYMIAVELMKEHSGYDILLTQSAIRHDVICLVIKLLCRSVQSRANLDGTLNLLQTTFESQSFLQNLMNFISEIKYNAKEAFEYLPMLTDVMEHYLRAIPVVAFKAISNLTDVSVGVMHHLKQQDPVSAQKLEQKLGNLGLLIEDSRAKLQQSQKPEERRKRKLDLGDPPDDYKDIKVIPICEELNTVDTPFVRQQIISGGFENHHHYLDIQFRLLREDFVRPLREGIQQFRLSFDNSRKAADIRIYRRVTFDNSEIGETAITYFLKLEIKKNFNIETSKRFMFGNILCISYDNFKTMIIASVSSREKLKENLLGVKLETSAFNLDTKKTYSVIESKAYFVSYKHTLLALQQMKEVPLEDNIVLVNQNVLPPGYLRRATVYEITVKLEKENEFPIDVHSNTYRVPVFAGIEHFPSRHQLRLDESQRRALHGALTRQLAIIQGPPGTGKTFLGLQITKILLENKEKWSIRGTHPILVVCYTNHALDQFLDGILTFTKNIVRVGSRSKNESLAEYQIHAQVRFHKVNSDDFAINQQQYSARRSMAECKHNIESAKRALRSMNINGIFDKHTFSIWGDIIPSHILNQLPTLQYFLLDFWLYNVHAMDSVDAGKIVSSGTCNDVQVGSGAQDTIRISGLETSIENKDSDENCSSTIEDELLEYEENERKLDDDDDDFQLITVKGNLPSSIYQNFELTSMDLQESCQELQDFLSNAENFAHFNDINEEINIIKTKLRALEVGLRVPWTTEECHRIEQTTNNINSLSYFERWKLYCFWRSKLGEKYEQYKQRHEQQFIKDSKTMNSFRNLLYLNLMRKVEIVGMTTTGAAQYCDLLHDLGPPIVIVEEAAEIMESHVISALSSGCQHLILIGDHQQLRPKPNVYELGTKYHLDVSLFERMVRNGVQYETLDYQHRMKPMISNLLVPTIYEDLKDHDSVLTYPKIRGVQKDMFFLSHCQYENSKSDDNESFENFYEAEFLMGLSRHLILQGYFCEDVTIITPYSGQFRCLKKLQKETRFHICSRVRISILDDYQGEESNIILLSLVRSNVEEKVGFVKTNNRICVALSRAKYGMYIIGNMDQMTKASDLWSKINEKLVDGCNIGPRLRLRCQNHPHQPIEVSSYEEILRKSPSGGCDLPCSEILLKCNHRCPRTCHVMDMDHEKILCSVPCPKILCRLGHQCPKLCHQPCAPCIVLVEKTLPCSHKHMVACSTDPATVLCETKVEKVLIPCKHVVKTLCRNDPAKLKCPKDCTTRLDCGHKCKLTCHARDDPNHEKYDCMEACENSPENCEFNHKCNKRCYETCGQCTVLINRIMKCGHTMGKVMCGIPEEKLDCQVPCQKQLPCGHKCPRKCHEPCGGCAVAVEKIAPECGHKVKVACSKLPSIRDCTGRCVKPLACFHPCRAKCNEPCTPKCLELCQSASQCPRGHIMKLPCHLLRFNSAVTDPNILNGKTMGEYCTSECGAKLDCNHTCKSPCGDCLNGRLHATCMEQCERQQVCGHLCKSPCRDNCPPCQNDCIWKCSHSGCKKKCGTPCFNCKEKCNVGCRHSVCTKKCGDECDRKPCDQPCTKTLRCGHPCIGYCGEPCPRLCRICNHDEVTTVIFGTEDEENARFVMLEDCGHVFEGESLETWMKTSFETSDGQPVEICMKKCMLCNKPIYNTKRYQNYILAAYNNVKRVKQRYFNTKSTTKKAIMFRNALKELSRDWKEEVDALARNVGLDSNFMPRKKMVYTSQKQSELYEFQISFLTEAKRVKETIGSHSERLQDLIARLMKQSELASRQTMDEMTCELRRLECCFYVSKLQQQLSLTPEVAQILNEVKTVMDPAVRFDNELEKKVKNSLKDAQRYIGTLGISDSERRQILTAMQLSQGHWYACPNGHVYCIDACGGAMEEGKCPECKSAIGGSSHRLRVDNRVATEMDGATRSAWPGP